LQEIAISSSVTPETQATLQEKTALIPVLQHNLFQAQKYMKKYADLHRTPRQFQLGDMVYLKLQPQRETSLGRGQSLKLSSQYYGPFRVIQKIGHTAYKLLLTDDAKIHNVFHVNQLKKHLGPQAIPNKKLPLVTSECKIKLEPLTVLQRRQIPQQEGEYAVLVPQWLVHSEGMTPDEATWEDAYFIQEIFSNFQP
jgi:hypothetical protein